jgi:hypothetical protein
MAYQKFLIAPPKSGQQTNLKPFLIADDAYEELRNMLVWRGRVKKRFGARVMDQSVIDSQQQKFTRLRLQIATTDGAGAFAGIVPYITSFSIGQMFSIGDVYFTIQALGAVVVTLTTGFPASMAVNTNTGNFAAAGADPLTAIFFYPSTPVMNFWLYNQIDVNSERTIAFDQRFSYEYSTGTGWNRSGTVFPAVTPGLWTGTDHDFYWATNWFGVTSNTYFMFVVNNVIADGIQYFDGLNWFILPPPVLDAAGSTLQTALITLAFKDRLLFLNTTELVAGNPLVFTNRVRYSQNGSPLQVDAFTTAFVGKGGFIEAPTKESIISAEFLKDRLIVVFESSTWELVYNGNQVLPFSFQKINTEIGVESTHSVIPFDKVILGMGSTGIHACNGLNVERIDEEIPSTIFDISNINFGPQRIQGIRDYFQELSYWTYPSTEEAYEDNDVFPNRVLVFDYRNGTWAFNDDSITALGYFYLQDDYLIWQNISSTWAEMTQTWDDGESNNLFRSVIAGNQQGWTFIVDSNLMRNCMSLQITNIATTAVDVTLTIINHNLSESSLIFIDNIDDDIGNLDDLNGTIQRVDYVDANTVRLLLAGFAGTYNGQGTVERVSEIGIKTKEYNFFPNEGKWVYIPYVDFYVDRTDNGQVLVEYYSSSSFQQVASAANQSGALLGTSILETSPYALKPYEVTQERFWHRVYFQMDGEVVQLFIKMNDDQLFDPDIVFSEFTINAVMYYAQPTQTYI